MSKYDSERKRLGLNYNDDQSKYAKERERIYSGIKPNSFPSPTDRPSSTLLGGGRGAAKQPEGNFLTNTFGKVGDWRDKTNEKAVDLSAGQSFFRGTSTLVDNITGSRLFGLGGLTKTAVDKYGNDWMKQALTDNVNAQTKSADVINTLGASLLPVGAMYKGVDLGVKSLRAGGNTLAGLGKGGNIAYKANGANLAKQSLAETAGIGATAGLGYNVLENTMAGIGPGGDKRSNLERALTTTGEAVLGGGLDVAGSLVGRLLSRKLKTLASKVGSGEINQNQFDEVIEATPDLKKEILALPEGQKALPEPIQQTKMKYKTSEGVNVPENLALPEPPTQPFANKVSELERTLSKSGKTLDEFNDAVTNQFNYLKQSMKDRGGVSQGTIGEGIGNFKEVTGAYRYSENPRWYQKFYKENNRVPNNTDLKKLAEEHVLEGFADNSMNVPAYRPKEVDEIDFQIDKVQSRLKELQPQKKVNIDEFYGKPSNISKDEWSKIDDFEKGGYIYDKETIDILNAIKPLEGETFKLKKNNEYAIIHPSTKGKKYQISFFDEKGAKGDAEANAIEDVASKLHEYDYFNYLDTIETQEGQSLQSVLNVLQQEKPKSLKKFQDVASANRELSANREKLTNMNDKFYPKQEGTPLPFKKELYNPLQKESQKFVGQTNKLSKTKVQYNKPKIDDNLLNSLEYGDKVKVRNGRSEVELSFVKREGDQVVVKRNSGKETVVPASMVNGKVSPVKAETLATSELKPKFENVSPQKETPLKKVKDLPRSEPKNVGDADTFRNKVSRNAKDNKEPFSKRVEKLRSQAEDDLIALSGLEKRVKGKVSSAEDSLYKSARTLKGLPEKSLQIVKDRLTPIVKGIEKAGYKSNDLGDYALAVHAKDIKTKGIETGMTTKEIDDVIAKYGTKEMESARKELLKINNDMLDALVDGQVITRELVDQLQKKHPNYMAMFREMDDDAVGFASGMSRAITNVNSPIKTLVGSKKKIIDPLESMVKNIFQSIQAAEKNKVALQLPKLAKLDTESKFIRKLDPDEKVERKNVVTVLENGEKVRYEVEPEVYKALLNLDQKSSGIIIRALSKPASVLRAGATLTPEFGLRNPIRDVVQAYTTSGSGFNPVTDFVPALFDVIAGKSGKGGKIYKQWLDDMGAYGNIISTDRKANREALTSVLKDSKSKKFINIVSQKSTIALLRTISDVTESATKLGEYKAALRQGKKLEGKEFDELLKSGVSKEQAQRLAKDQGVSRAEAAYRSRDVMDFARSGSSVREVNKIVAFFNASVQGKSKILRTIKSDPVGFTTRAFSAVTVPTIGVFMMQKYMSNDVQKQTIDDAPNWMRNTFWLVPVPNTDLVARIPKPFDLAIPFANLPEKALEYAFNNEKEAFEGFAKESAKGLGVPTQITGMLPIVEGMANYSFFREGKIIPRREDNLNFSDQYDNETSGAARLLAKGAEKLTGGEGSFKNFSSPRIMDNTIRGTTAGLGTYYTSFADWIAEGLNLTDKPDKPKKGVSQLPLTKAFLVNENQSSKSLDYIYSEKEKFTKEKGSAKLNKEPFKSSRELSFLNDRTKTISSIGKEIRNIKESKLLNPLEKKNKIDALVKRRNEIARKTEESLKN